MCVDICQINALSQIFLTDFFHIGIHSMQVKQPLQGMELKGNKENQDENHTKKVIKKRPKTAGAC